MIRPLYNWVMRQAESRHALPALIVVSFAESSFFPIPPDVMLAPMVARRPEKAYVFAFWCTLASVIGGVAGYAIGYYLQDLGRWLLALTGNADGLTEFKSWYQQYGAAVILVKGLTPIPYKLVTIASGMAHYHLGAFIALSAITRGGRFFLTAAVLKRFGPRILEIVERRLMMTTVALLALIVGGIVLAKLLH